MKIVLWSPPQTSAGSPHGSLPSQKNLNFFTWFLRFFHTPTPTKETSLLFLPQGLCTYSSLGTLTQPALPYSSKPSP